MFKYIKNTTYIIYVFIIFFYISIYKTSYTFFILYIIYKISMYISYMLRKIK